MIVSLAVPVYDMKGEGVKFLQKNLRSILSQKIDFDLEIVVSDQSLDDDIENFLNVFPVDGLKYLREPNRGNHSCNTNNVLKNCSGDFIKILYQDDYFMDEFSLQKTINALKNSDKKWLVSACCHSRDGIHVERPFQPVWNENMLYGENTYSAPSVVAIRQECKETLFDENILYMPDVEYYHRMDKLWGKPLYFREITVVNMTHPNQTQHLIHDKMQNDLKYIKKKYENIGII
jgi:glycosyltransferase involved in cell wall biosynthesis